jgi:hypothetical protein
MKRAAYFRRLFASIGPFAGLLLAAGVAQADVLYEYAQPFQATANCPTDQVLEVSVVFATAIPPNTPLPSMNNPGVVRWSFSACGETCAFETQPCGLGGMSEPQAFRFATDASGVPDEWEVSKFYSPAPGESVAFATTRRVADGIEGDLYQDTRTGTEGVSTFLGTWTVTEIAGSVPVASVGGRIGLVMALLAVGMSALLLTRFGETGPRSSR